MQDFYEECVELAKELFLIDMFHNVMYHFDNQFY